MSTTSTVPTIDNTFKTPLDGLIVLELGHFVAAPFCTRLLGDLGAEVYKIEPLNGDPVRRWGESVDGNSLWWSIHGRNKKCISVDLKQHVGRDIALRLAAKCDVVVDNFRPGQLTSMGLGPDTLRSRQPSLVIAQISGYGQDGPYRDRAAFGVIGEAIGGLRHLTNHAPGTTSLPPVRVGVSIGDSIAGLYAAFGVMAALWQRDRAAGDGKARTLDIALTESVLSMMEGMLPEYGALGKVKQPTGGAIATAAPSNSYATADGVWVLIAANSEPLFKRLVGLIGAPSLVMDPRFIDNAARVRNSTQLDQIISAWSSLHSAESLMDLLDQANIPACKAYTAVDCANDPQFRHRGMVREVHDPLFGPLLHTGIVPHVPESPGRIRWTGAPIGHHTREVLGQVLGMTTAEISALYQAGAVK